MLGRSIVGGGVPGVPLTRGVGRTGGVSIEATPMGLRGTFH